MAKSAKKGTAVAVRKEASTAVALPDFLKGYRGPMGTENIESKDVTIPRLKVAQAISEEVKDGSLKEGSLFLNVTGDAVYTPEGKPIRAIIVAQTKEYILWRPRKDGGGILARAKPVRDPKTGVTRYAWDKPKQTFDVKVEGKTKVKWTTKQFIDEDGLGDWGSEIPNDKDSGIAATAHHNYIVVLPELDNLIAAVSMSRSQAKKAKDLNAAIKMGKAGYPLHSRFWLLSTVDDKNANGDQYKNWKVVPDGYMESANDHELFAYADQIARGFQETGFSVDHSDGGDDGDDDSGDQPV